MQRNQRLQKSGRVLALVFLLCVGIAGQAFCQCILANPSFEVNGSGGSVFGGWGQFGQFGMVANASHGSQAARLSGPNSGDWDASGYWQRLDSEPGEQWEATGHVQHSAQSPLTGGALAFVNVEWRDASDQLIDYDSFVVADPGTATDTYIDFSVLSDPAPAGTVAIHYLLGVLQGPSDPSPDVYFDQVTIHSTSSPTIDELQWNDFPGGTTLEFGERTWRVKGPGYYGPGPNVFSDEPDCVWVDGEGQLHLTLTDRDGPWTSTEVTLEDALGYGDYVVTTVGSLDLLDPQAVLGIFLWQYGPCWDPAYLWWNAFNEIDIEYSRWGNPADDIAQFVAQPFDWFGNTERFDVTFGETELASHAMRWLPDRVEFRVWRGGLNDESAQTMVHEWTYTGPHIPRPEQPRMHLNLWKLEGTPDADQEIVFQDFKFIPDGVASDVVQPGWLAAATPNGRLMPVGPSPFFSRTTIRFDLARGEFVDLGVFSLDGRRVRSLANGFVDGGIHATDWDGRDDRGRELSSGVYVIRLKGLDFVETRRAVLIR